MKYFTFSELIRSETAGKLGIDNRPDSLTEAHLVELVDKLLDPLREAWGGPIAVTSGYRCEALNKVVGGSSTSAHLCGWAADLVPGSDDGRSTAELVNFATEWLTATGLAFDQLIDERSGGARWLHLGIRNQSAEQRGQFLLYDNGKYVKL